MADRRGLALLVMIFAIVIVGAVVSTGYIVAGQQFRIGIGGGGANGAFYAAEAGLDAALYGWDRTVAAIEPGSTRLVASGSLSSGDEYSVRLTRVDGARHESTAYYVMVSTGYAHGPWGGRRQVALFLRARLPSGICCEAALATWGNVTVTGASTISGDDVVASSWAPVPESCDGVAADAGPGVVLYGGGSLVEASGGSVQGRPASSRLEDGESNLLASLDRWFAELAADADHRLPGDTVLARIEPAVDADGACEPSAVDNWGAPAVPGHPCLDYLPIVHAAGNLRITAPSRGQGILLIEGDLELDGGFEFHGVVIVKGGMTIRGGRVFGGVIVFDLNRVGVAVGDGARIELSSCAVGRALRGPKLYLPHPLAEFAWLEILE
ncbi:MAG: hypothetical protein JSV86_02130 [Gemmatimonadota bacterium]|nr:MAG: hypothetical protein JSV86_02130 [Gemmatimonadota bacterium]